jgi:DNA invertase Pin-like site-specific DNA recombinase
MTSPLNGRGAGHSAKPTKQANEENWDIDRVTRAVQRPTMRTLRSKSKRWVRLGCKRIFEEKTSGSRWDRPELHRALEQPGEGSVLVVWRLDRLFAVFERLAAYHGTGPRAGAGFQSLTEALDTTAAAGRLIMQML